MSRQTGHPTASSQDSSPMQRQRMERSLDTLDTLLRESQREWPDTAGARANPLDIALSLLDNSSVGKASRYNEFLELKQRIEQGLRGAVNEHFQSFNDSIGSYRNVVLSVAESRGAINKIQESVKSVGEKSEQEEEVYRTMGSLNDNFKTYNEMIEVLGVIERTKNIPGELDSAMSAKNYARAQKVLQEAYDSADKYRIWELPAMSNFKDYFQAQEDQLFEILVEELHSILYSKRQFVAYNTIDSLHNSKSSTGTGYSEIEEFLVGSIDTDISAAAALDHLNIEAFIRMLNSTNDTDDEAPTLQELSILQDNNNPFIQLQAIMTIIHKLGKLGKSIDVVVQRFGLELTQMINRIVEDTKLRHPKLVKLLNGSEGLKNGNDESYRSIISQDLFWNFFKKLLFFLQNVRVMTEIHRKLTGNDSTASQAFNSSPGDSAYDGAVIYRFWTVLHKEVQALIMTYISTEDTTTLGTKLTTTSSLKNSAQKKPLFQFYQVEYDSMHTTQLKNVLQDLFPGFINSNDMSLIESPYIEDSKFLKQAKIIPSDVMNMRYILAPFLLFIQGSSHLIPKQDEPFAFFTEFMKSEFIPLLEESFVSDYFEEVESVEAWEMWEPTSDLQMLVKGGVKQQRLLEIVVQFKTFLDDVLFTLSTSLQFRIEFIPIIFKLLEKFEDKIEGVFNELFNDLISFLEPSRDLISAFKNKTAVTANMLGTRNKVEFKQSHIFVQLETLQNSMDLLLGWFKVLVKKVDLNKTDLNLSQIEKLRKTWLFFQVNSVSGRSETDPLDLVNTNKLILNDELAVKFTEIVAGYEGVKFNVDGLLGVYRSVLETM